MQHFIYVFTAADRDLLAAQGYPLLRSDEENHIYILGNCPPANAHFTLETVSHCLSDQLTFSY